MRQRRTDFRMWAVMAFAMLVAYVACDHFIGRDDIIGEALYRYEIHGFGRVVIRRCAVPCLVAALVAVVLGWIGQAIAIRLGFRLSRAPDPALIADFDDGPKSNPRWLRFLSKYFGFRRADEDQTP